VNEAIYLADTIYVMSSRPTTIKKSYSVDVLRPRDISEPNCIQLIKNIENDIETEFSLDKIETELNLNEIVNFKDLFLKQH